MTDKEKLEMMDEMTVFEVRVLHELFGMNATTGNGHLCSIQTAEKTAEAEAERIARGC
ncbi:MAG: hypothetical protein IKX20_07750 [Paludibacteraceae bacterium]|nr:hypothetical protein [Paludibacteraceae bacterium]